MMDNADILIVIGSTAKARSQDYPAARTLRRHLCRAMGHEAAVAIITDKDYLNYFDPREIPGTPVIAVGGPCSNYATVALYEHIPQSLILANTAMIQTGSEPLECRACLWGMGQAGTAMAVKLFITRRHMDRFIRKLGTAAASTT